MCNRYIFRRIKIFLPFISFRREIRRVKSCFPYAFLLNMPIYKDGMSISFPSRPTMSSATPLVHCTMKMKYNSIIKPADLCDEN
ncbi:hypothetical protein CDL12_13595 [Handroanthus impetiginosus]|uniref:Uncharacterized protein n=1 Tax=Handroanthus impetiginosus TaxID=429701 RepID=A0A2G9H8F5_9LAMI|nr:hypothetical protein CDL12_13595 [Handroanthus impetiginosus]